MHRIITIILFSISVVMAAEAGSRGRMEQETLHYNVMFKWGLINKKAGTATLSLSHGPKCYLSRLTAASEPWADRIYRVRDTLYGKMDYADLTPLYYEKIAHESNEVKHDVVKYNYDDPDSVKAFCTRKAFKKKVLRVDDSRTLSAAGETVDMLSSFYYMRRLPYQDWAPGHTAKLTIFSGKQKETLSIRYDGKSDLQVGDTTVPTYHITFIFTSKGGNKSSDDMEAWISADNRRIPMRLEGKLPVGKVHCILSSAL